MWRRARSFALKKKLILSVAAAVLGLALAVSSFVFFQLRGAGNADLAASLTGAASYHAAPANVVSSTYDLSAHQTLSRVILLISEKYVEPERVKPYEMFLAALDQIQKTIPEVIVDDSQAPRHIRISAGDKAQTFNLDGLDQLWEVTMALRDIFRFLQGHIEDAEAHKDIEYAAINGMLSVLDPHSVLLKPESFDEVRMSTRGEFGGLGIVISIRDNALTIIAPIDNTPASRAGLKAKDKVVKIEEESTINMSLEEAVSRLRGKPGSKITIWVKRKKWTEPKRFVLTRAIIKIESVTSKLLAGGVGFVRINSFQNNTYDDLHTHLEKLRAENKKELTGLVLDLRTNPGGLLDQAILISDRFIDRGPLVITVGEGNRKRDVRPAHFSGTETAYPMAVLVDGGSASASEIVAGAIKNHNRGFIIGQQTFGKGSVQVLYDFKDKSALKLTIAQYLTPGDVSIQSVGISPDIEVRHATVDKDDLHLFFDDRAPREKDLDKHLERHVASTAATDKPAATIVHYVPKEPEPEENEEVEEEPNAFVYDFEIELAHEVLRQTNSTDRRTILTQAGELLDKKSAGEKQRIAEQLAKLGADWSNGPKADDPRVEIQFTTNTAAGAIKAGETLTMTAKVRNTGSSTLYQLHGITASDNPLLDNREFAFGKLAPGASASWVSEVKLPQEMSARADRVELELRDQHATIKGTQSDIFVVIDELPKPLFAFTYGIDDVAKGNGDGMLQVGEEVELVVNVRNTGRGVAKDPVVTLKNMTGPAVFLAVGRDKPGVIAPNGAAQGRLRFTVREAAENIEMRLAIWDAELGSATGDLLHIPVIDNQKVKNEARSLRVGAKDIPIYGGAAATAPIIAYARAGSTLAGQALVGADGSWRRISTGKGRIGFVQGNAVKTSRGRLRQTPAAALRGEIGQAAPTITMDIGSLITKSDSMRINGAVSDATGLKDFFVFVNEKKVHYSSLKNIKAEGDGFASTFDINLPLEKGANTIAIIARESDDIITRRIFGLYRDAPEAIADKRANNNHPRTR